jgi:monothiol glutaredoxin
MMNMSLEPALRQRIESILARHPVVLFMKGNRQAPRCGFSAATVDALGSVIEEFHDVDVLADPDLREGIKQYGQWPTIPQLYVRGELVGGADIVQAMLNSGELHTLLGQQAPDRTPPRISISAPAADAIREALAGAQGAALHLAIDANFNARFELKPASGQEIVSVAADIEILMNPSTARRADGLAIDWAETVQGAGLVLKNPNAPGPVPSLSVTELAQRLRAGSIVVVDVRPAAERARAPFPQARALEEVGAGELARWPKTEALAFLCHLGNSSRAAAERFRALGFTEVYNVAGGIEAWSREIDPALPRY